MRRAVPDAQGVAAHSLEDVALVAGAAIGALDAVFRDLPDFEALEDAGLLSKDKLLAGEIMPGFADDGDAAAMDE